MNLKHVQAVEDHGSHFVVTHAKHGSFKVAKKGLAKGACDAIQKLCRGGEVRGYSGESGDPADQVVMDMAPNPSASAMAFLPPTPVAPAPVYGFESGSLVNAPPGSEISNMPFTPLGQGRPGMALPAAAEQDLEAARAGDAHPPAAPAPAEAPKPAEQGVGGSGDLLSMFATSAPKLPGIRTGPSYDKDIDTATKQEADAVQAQAQNQADLQNALAQNQATTLQNIRQRMRDGDVAYQKNLAAQNQMMQDVANSKVDPNRYWNSKTTGQKFAGAIGLILGGIGAGMTHGPNQVLGLMQQAAERDMEAQKSELGKKENLLSQYMSQGHDIQNAMQMGVAHELALGEGQLRQLAAKYAGTGAAAAAQQAIAQLQQRRIQLLLNAHSDALGNAVKSEQLRGLQFENAMRGNQLALVPLQREISAKAALGKGLDDREYLVGRMTGAVDPKLDVKLDDGLHYLASDEKAAGDIRDSQEAASRVAAAAQQIKAFREQHSGGVTWDRGAVGRAQQLKQEVLAGLQDLASKTPRGGELVNEFAKSISDPDSWGTDSRINGQMDAIVDRTRRFVLGAARSRLQGGGGQRSGGLTVKRAGG